MSGKNKTPLKEIPMKHFIRKNLLGYLIPNVLINTCIPYLCFKDLDAIYLFQGEQNLARFLLPMSLFLPFLITFDILRKTAALFEEGHPAVSAPDKFLVHKKRFIWRMAGINACCCILFVSMVLLLLYLVFPLHYSFDGTLLAVLTGILAGIYSVLFTYLPISAFVSIRQMPRFSGGNKVP